MNWDILDNKNGKKLREVKLSDDLFAVEQNDALIHRVVKGYQSNRRQGTHATKTRAFVSGGGKKPYKQKGTGNARQGSSRSPLWVGGAVCHGPQPRLYKQSLSKKARQLACRIVLSDKARHNALFVIDQYNFDKFSTKQALSLLGSLKIDSALFLDNAPSAQLVCSVRNLHGSAVKESANVNAEDLIRYKNLVISESALQALGERLGGDQ